MATKGRGKDRKEPGWTMLAARVDPALHRAIKVLAAEQGRTVAELVDEALRSLLRRHGKEA